MAGGTSPSKVLRDTHFRPEEPGSAIALTLQDEWKGRAKRLFDELEAESSEAPPPKKLQRVCAVDWVKAVDWKLQVLAWAGLSSYQRAVPTRSDRA